VIDGTEWWPNCAVDDDKVSEGGEDAVTDSTDLSAFTVLRWTADSGGVIESTAVIEAGPEGGSEAVPAMLLAIPAEDPAPTSGSPSDPREVTAGSTDTLECGTVAVAGGSLLPLLRCVMDAVSCPLLSLPEVAEGGVA
jgi:hypothetical protein